MRAIVVLPEPDSPTIASDRAVLTRSDTSATATRSPNSLRRPAASRTGAPSVSVTGRPSKRAAELVRAHAPGQPAVQLGQPGHGGPAGVPGVAAPRRERALRHRRLEGRHRPAGNRKQPVRGPGDV